MFFFGEVLQLRPVQARQIFDEPICENYALSHLADPLWKKFDVIMLINNHRQGKDNNMLIYSIELELVRSPTRTLKD